LNPGHDNFTLKNCIIANFAIGIDINDSDAATITNSAITSDASAGGFHAINIAGSDNTAIANVTVTQTNTLQTLEGTMAIECRQCNHLVITGTTAISVASQAIAIWNSNFTALTDSFAYSNSSSGASFVHSPNNTITNSTIKSNTTYALSIYGNSNGTISTNSAFISDKGQGIFIDMANHNLFVNSSIAHNLVLSKSFDNTFINTAFNRSGITWDRGNLTVKWYVNFTVNDIYGAPVASAAVNATPSFGGQSLFNGTTDGNGQIWGLAELIEFTAKGPFRYNGSSQQNFTTYNDYTAYANGAPYAPDYTRARINESKTIQIILSRETGPKKAPVLLSPNSGVKFIFQDLFFGWKPATGTYPAKYWFDAWVDGVHAPFLPEGGKNMGMSTAYVLASGDVETIAKDGMWEWAVAAEIGGIKYWSEKRAIYKHTAAVLIGPQDGKEVQVNGLFDWQDVEGADNYVVKIIGILPGGGPVYMPLNSEEPQFVLTQPYYDVLKPGITYRWAVAGTALGAQLAGTDPRLKLLSYGEERSFKKG
ncbi:MAG: right-handed parallel beta-helix repeat-containing protein, partial [Candidatus Burarchaeum sp.]